MDDEQIILLGRALDREHERMSKEGGYPNQEDDKTARLLEHLGSDIAKLTAENQERGEALLARLANSDNPYERNLALAAVRPLGMTDYEFAREMLLTVHELHNRDGDPDGAYGWYHGLSDDLAAAGRHDQADDLYLIYR